MHGIATDVAPDLDTNHNVHPKTLGLGANSSASFVRAPEGNGGAAALIKTLKENPVRSSRLNTTKVPPAAAKTLASPPCPSNKSHQIQRRRTDLDVATRAQLRPELDLKTRTISR